MESSSLSKFKEASWQSRSFHGNRGQLVGSITTESDGVVPVTLSFVKGESGWKMYSIQKPHAGVQVESSHIQIPTEEEQVRLVAEAMHVFAESVKEKSMGKFHSHISNL